MATDDFNDFIESCGLTEMKSMGAKFSWCNGQRGLARSWSKLDRCLLNPLAVELLLDALYNCLPHSTSDHAPMLLVLKSQASFSEELESELLIAKEELAVWLLREETRLSQQAKIRWMEKGKASAQFFKTFASVNKPMVKEMRLRDGSCLSTPKAIHVGAVEFLSDFLKARPRRATPDLSLFVQNVVTEEENNTLLQLPSIQEVKEAMFSILADSSPGLDGFWSGFYCSCWDIVEADVVVAVRKFLSGATLPRFYSASYIVLLPKVPNLTGFDKFRPISLCSVVYKGAPLISYLLYADDIIVFANGGKSSLRAIWDAFAQYEDWSGQVVSKEKSSIFFPKLFTSAQKRSALRISSFSEGSFPVKYLGAPLVSGRMKVIHFDGLIHRIRSQLKGWQTKFLSSGAHLLLLRHIVASVPIHLLSVLYAPKAVVASLNRLMNVEVSLFMKFAWKLLTQNSIWVNFFKAKYVKERHISLIEASKGSLLWKRIIAVLPKVLSNAKWKVRDGHVSIWRDNWLSSGAIIDSCEILELPLLTIKECRIHNGWDVDLLKRLVGESKLEEILTSLGEQKDGADILIWKPSLDGNFCSKLAWECIRFRAPKSKWARWIWHSALPKKYSVIMWKALNFCLSVDARIEKLRIPVVSKCECCVRGCLEDQDHVLATGTLATEIWHRALLSLGMPFDPSRP
ncbi:uncharacterized protein LOC121238132 [Juglans microcarpa x Juglans regia]|uniref:uncharacterized protein LOC121238132 n=1 Tax=Juglans microcarpa x Juglans regia TaxID=2249226 RepID=UPI001B7EE664|nr:uncharacterized protein LOC121238132 [Juglans microcarpa x Juglans regia]